jgi:hypothetical protein
MLSSIFFILFTKFGSAHQIDKCHKQKGLIIRFLIVTCKTLPRRLLRRIHFEYRNIVITAPYNTDFPLQFQNYSTALLLLSLILISSTSARHLHQDGDEKSGSHKARQTGELKNFALNEVVPNQFSFRGFNGTWIGSE